MEMLGMSQHALAKKLYTTQSTVRGWLDGASPRQRMMPQIAEALNVNVRWLSENTGPMVGIIQELGEAANRALYGNATLNSAQDSSVIREDSPIPSNAIAIRWVPVISWAHAGKATDYEELPPHWQDESVGTLCKDERAFALIVEGDSMEPRCVAGDRVIIMPSEEPRDGCLVVAKLKKDGVVLRRFSRLHAGKIKLIAYNPLYPSVDYSPADFHWIYPVESTVRKEWN